MHRVPFVLGLLLLAAPARAQCPPFPARGVQIIDALYSPQLAQGDDDQRRTLTRTFIEQLVYEFPNDGWAWKSADPMRPPSKDSIARMFNNRLCNWDWQDGSSRLRRVREGQTGDDITGQNPIIVAAVNHLGAPPVVTPPPQPPPSGFDVAVLRELLKFYDDRNEVRFLGSKAILDALYQQGLITHAKADALSSQLREHDTDPSWLRKVLSNKYVQMALIGAGSILTKEWVQQ